MSPLELRREKQAHASGIFFAYNPHVRLREIAA
jgi:hypothetical protein